MMKTSLNRIPGFVLTLTLTLCFAPTLQAAGQPGAGHPDGLAGRTVSLVALAKAYQQAQGIEKQALLDDLTDLARQRGALLSQLLEEGRPEAVLNATLPEKVRSGLPEAVQAFVERRTEVEGRLEVLYEHFGEESQLKYALVNADGRFPLHFASHPPKLATGPWVLVSGVEIQGEVAVESGETNITILALNGSESAQTSGSATPLDNTLGEQRTLVFLVNFQNRQEERYTVEEAFNLVFGTVSEFYRETSYGQTWLSGDVVGWYTLPIDQPVDSASCKTSIISQYAQAAAVNAGVDLSAYDHYVYVFPQTSCFPTGSGTVGGYPSEAWINGNWFNLKTVGHEFGHNLGLFHSASLECGADTVCQAGQTLAYGDVLDIMGNSSVGHFNPFQKERLGWLNPVLGEIVTADQSGAYTLDAYETAPYQIPKALKIPKGTDPITGAMTWYYVESRKAVGFDDFLASNQNVLNGVVFRMADESDPRSGVLLDMTPGSSSTWDWGDPALASGASFQDPGSGLLVTSLANPDGSLTLDVQFSQSGCQRAAPLVAISPAGTQWMAPGTPVTFTVTVTNGDSAACGSSTFDLDAVLPPDWNALFDAWSLVLDPGTSASTVLEVTSAPAAADGFYTVDVVARNSADPAYSGSIPVTCGISQSLENQAPLPADDYSATLEGTSVIIDVMANDSDPDGDPLAVASVTQGTKGTVTVLSDGTIRYTPDRKFKGEDTFSYTVTDGELSATAQVAVLVERDAGGSGGGSGGGKGKPAR